VKPDRLSDEREKGGKPPNRRLDAGSSLDQRRELRKKMRDAGTKKNLWGGRRIGGGQVE